MILGFDWLIGQSISSSSYVKTEVEVDSSDPCLIRSHFIFKLFVDYTSFFPMVSDLLQTANTPNWTQQKKLQKSLFLKKHQESFHPISTLINLCLKKVQAQKRLGLKLGK